jgi:hypothetical protein
MQGVMLEEIEADQPWVQVAHRQVLALTVDWETLLIARMADQIPG